MAPDPKSRRFLYIELIQGRNITDGSTKPLDLVCKIELGHHRLESSCCKQSQNPTWRERFRLDITELSDSASVVVSCESVGYLFNSFVGEIRIPLIDHRHISLDLASQHWFPLLNPRLSKSSPTPPGELCLRIGSASASNNTTSTSDEIFDLRTASASETFAQAATIAKDSRDSATRSLNILTTTANIGDNNLHQLQEQGRAIDQMQSDMNSVRNNISQSERKLRGIESVWGALANTVTSSRAKKVKSHADRDALKHRKARTPLARTATVHRAPPVTSAVSNPMLSSIDADPHEREFQQHVVEIDHTLDKLDSLLSHVHQTAVNIGAEIDEHNTKLGHLQRDLTRATPRIETAIGRCGAIVK